MGKGPLFLNTPIASSVHDVVGVEMYVEKLDMAIDAGAQMIALTSPFGAGKSSVIELLQKKRKDLDRTDASEVILQFLKELRKYYVPERTAVSYLNRVTFLVNIKPEAELAGSEAESLYAKMFDYILPLRTINIDNYDAVLNGLLAEHSEELYEYTHGRLVNGTLRKKYTNRRKGVIS